MMKFLLIKLPLGSIAFVHRIKSPSKQVKWVILVANGVFLYCKLSDIRIVFIIHFTFSYYKKSFMKNSFLILFFIIPSICTYGQNTKQYNSNGNINSVKIGSQIWMTENLNVDHFRNGDPIPEAKSKEEWKAAGYNQQPAWCYYDNDPSTGEKYGRIYNWYAVNDPRGLAPLGWRIPRESDWKMLVNQLGKSVGEKMKSRTGWIARNGKNSSGFNALPAGERWYIGNFSNINESASWWSTFSYESNGKEVAQRCALMSTLDWLHIDGDEKGAGHSIRCIRN